MADYKNFFDDLMDTYKRTSDYRDSAVRDIGLNRSKYAEHLDEMWSIYLSGNLQQIGPYKNQIKYIKDAGFTVQRSKSTGKHRIV